MYTFLLAPVCTAWHSAGLTGPENLPHPILRRRELIVRFVIVACWKKARAQAGSTKVTNYAGSSAQFIGKMTHAHSDVLIMHMPDLLQHTSPDVVADFCGSGIRTKITEVDVSVPRLPSRCWIHVARSHSWEASTWEDRRSEIGSRGAEASETGSQRGEGDEG